jgi:hypothetical protein
MCLVVAILFRSTIKIGPYACIYWGTCLNACSWWRDDIQSCTYFYVTLYIYIDLGFQITRGSPGPTEREMCPWAISIVFW